MSVLRLGRSKTWPCLTVAISTALLPLLQGCAHALEVTNLSLYKSSFITNRASAGKIGLSAVTTSPEEERFVIAVGNALKRDGFVVAYPFYPNEQSANSMDFLVKLTTSSEYKGSGWNFLINWPGFLVWAPAWHGYNYRVIYTFDADITTSKTGTQLPRITIPVDLDIRHADMGRTWTEISWLEWSVIAFAGGLAFTRYDRDITPQLVDATENKIADYVSSKIASTLIGVKEGLTMEGGQTKTLRLHMLARTQ